MSNHDRIFLGTDSGATTAKTAAVRGDGSHVSGDLLQRATRSEDGPAAVVQGWIAGAEEYLETHGLSWDQVEGVGVAIPGPRRSYGVLEMAPNMPESFAGWDVHRDYTAALEAVAGRKIPLAIGNDGNLGGVAEAQRVRGDGAASVIMLAPGSGLGGAYVDGRGLPLDGDTFAGSEMGHLPAPLHLLDDVPPIPCGCGRRWGCYEVYTSLAGLPVLLERALEKAPGHPLAASTEPPKKKALSLRGLAQEGDELALGLFDFQARAMGLLVGTLAMAFDPEYFVIGGGLMDPGSTTGAFREGYLQRVRSIAEEYLWSSQRGRVKVVPAAMGELSQAIGAALVALYQFGGDD